MQEREKGERCSRRRKDGTPCRGWSVIGSSPPSCRMHVGRNSKGIELLHKHYDALLEVGRLARAAGSDMHPIDHLLDSLYRSAAEVEVFGQIIADLDNAGEVGASDVPGRQRGWVEWHTVVDPDTGRPRRVLDLDPLLVQGSDNAIRTHPFLDEYNKALERRGRFAKMAMEAGVAERQVAVAESQAMMMASAVRSILTELGVPLDRRAVTVVQSHLRELGHATMSAVS